MPVASGLSQPRRPDAIFIEQLLGRRTPHLTRPRSPPRHPHFPSQVQIQSRRPQFRRVHRERPLRLGPWPAHGRLVLDDFARALVGTKKPRRVRQMSRSSVTAGHLDRLHLRSAPRLRRTARSGCPPMLSSWRIRAERRCGELLAEMEKAKGAAQPGVGRAGGTGSQRATTLSDLGISKTQASRWRKLAEVPEKEFEATFARPEKPSTTGIINRGAGKKRNLVDDRASGYGANCSISRGMACTAVRDRETRRRCINAHLCETSHRGCVPAEIIGTRWGCRCRLLGCLNSGGSIAVDGSKRTRRWAGGSRAE